MRDTGVISAVSALDAGGGDGAWSDLGNLVAEDGSYTSCDPLLDTETSNLLEVDFDFEDALTNWSAVIYGLEVTIKCKSQHSANGNLSTIRFWDPFAPLWHSDNKTSPQITTTNTLYTFGSSSDPWGAVDQTFLGTSEAGRMRLVLAFYATGIFGNRIYIDHVTMRMYYGQKTVATLTSSIAITAWPGDINELDVSTDVAIGQILHVDDFHPDLMSDITLSQELAVQFARSFPLETTIHVWQNIGRYYDLAVSNQITITQAVFRAHFLSSSVALSDAAVGWAAKNAVNDIIITDEATATKILNLAVENSIAVSGHCLGSLPPIDLCVYAPWNADSTHEQPPDTMTFGLRTTLQLIGLTTITPRLPAFGDQISVDPYRVLNISRGRKLIPHRTKNAPAPRTLTFTVPVTDAGDYDELITWLEANLGRQVTIDDGCNFRWTGVCLEPSVEQTQTGRSTWNVTISIRGTRAAN